MSPSACNTTAQQPSERAYPSAFRSNVWHRPVADVIPATAQPIAAADVSIMLTPHARDRRHSPCSNERNALCVATSAAEQAVSYEAQGP
eukprot:6211890-Pleurochrysis_carterae.AAC.1